jgi:hypothetical protein
MGDIGLEMAAHGEDILSELQKLWNWCPNHSWRVKVKNFQKTINCHKCLY